MNNEMPLYQWLVILLYSEDECWREYTQIKCIDMKTALEYIASVNEGNIFRVSIERIMR